MAESISYQQYISLDTSESKAFIDEALSSAQEYLGKPSIPIHHIYLRLSIPIDPTSYLARNFQRTELVDKDKGIFVIYLGRRPNEYAYFGQLAHEVAHLIDAQVYDAYIEGANTVFAELFLKMKGLDWKGWEQYLQDGSDPFYGTTYLMMREVSAIIGNDGMKTLLLYSKWTDSSHTKKYIDINAWLQSLPKSNRHQVTETIKRHSAKVKQCIADTSNPSAFLLPQ